MVPTKRNNNTTTRKIQKNLEVIVVRCIYGSIIINSTQLNSTQHKAGCLQEEKDDDGAGMEKKAIKFNQSINQSSLWIPLTDRQTGFVACMLY